MTAREASELLKIVTALFEAPLGIVGRSDGSQEAPFRDYLDFVVHEWESGLEVNGWRIPEYSEIRQATIRREGALVYDGCAHSLGVVLGSQSFTGTIEALELRRHILSDPSRPSAIPFGWQSKFSHGSPSWGFCMPHNIASSIETGKYEVALDIEHLPGLLKVLEYTVPGMSTDVVLVNAHNCHPKQANDDLSGVAVGIRFFQFLQSLPRQHFTYKLLIAPEIIGPLFWLQKFRDTLGGEIAGSILLKSVGNSRPLRIQESFESSSYINRAALTALRSRFGSVDAYAYRSLYGNDETVFEAPPYNIPTISLTRWPFPEYHSSLDIPEQLDVQALEESFEALLAIQDALETGRPYQRNFEGLVNLSAHGLYKPHPGFDESHAKFETEAGKWHRLMNILPNLLERQWDTLRIANEFELPLDAVHEYLLAWRAAGLIID